MARAVSFIFFLCCAFLHHAHASSFPKVDADLIAFDQKIAKMSNAFYSKGGPSESGEWQLFPVEDPGRLEERRAKMGLEPLDGYVTRMNQWCRALLSPKSG